MGRGFAISSTRVSEAATRVSTMAAAVWAEDSGRSTTILKFLRIAASALVLYEVFVLALTK